MRQLTLTEYQASDPVELSVDERDALGSLVSSLTITPAHGSSGSYQLQPGSTVGMARVGIGQIGIVFNIPLHRKTKLY